MTKLEQKFKNRLKKNELMKNHTTFKIGGPARYFLEVKSGNELIEAVGLALADGLDYAVIGAGSNLLVSDSGFDGLVIRMSDVRCQMLGDLRLRVGAGLKLKDLSEFAMENRLTGLEWAFGVPGTVGGAVVMNAGCFGWEMRDTVVKVRYFNTKEIKKLRNREIKGMRMEELSNRQCEFESRESVFKQHPEWIIVEAELTLKKGDKKKIELQMKEYLKMRDEKLPRAPSAGSVFKKYEIEKKEKLDSKLERILKKEHPEFMKGKYIPAGWLIDEAGLKGKKIGGAQISERHGNFIVNDGGATAEQVMILISLIKQKVRNNFGIQLQEEVMCLGF